eukprot:Amastigsp_a842815_39.p2 type:complete len:344 gc:universal Amastigsp_a842815_39:679-1710(+)
MMGWDALEQLCLGVVARKAVARTLCAEEHGPDEDLKEREHKVEDLREAEQHEGFGEVAEDGHDRKRHARKVCVRVADKDRRRVPVVAEQRQRHRRKRQHQRNRKDMEVRLRVRKLDGVVREHRACDDERLPRLESIDPCIDIDGVGAEHSHAPHVARVHQPQVDGLAERSSQRQRHDDRGRAAVGDEQRERRKGREHELVAPTQIDDVVHEPEEHHEAHRVQGRVVLAHRDDLGDKRKARAHLVQHAADEERDSANDAQTLGDMRSERHLLGAGRRPVELVDVDAVQLVGVEAGRHRRNHHVRERKPEHRDHAPEPDRRRPPAQVTLRKHNGRHSETEQCKQR